MKKSMHLRSSSGTKAILEKMTSKRYGLLTLIYLFYDWFLVQTDVLKWRTPSRSVCVINKSKQSRLCLPKLFLRHISVVWYINHRKNDLKLSTCSKRYTWCSLHVEVFVSFLILYWTTKLWRDVNEGRHIWHCWGLFKTQWDKIHIHHSNTCIWTRHNTGCKNQVAVLDFPMTTWYLCKHGSPSPLMKFSKQTEASEQRLDLNWHVQFPTSNTRY